MKTSLIKLLLFPGLTCLLCTCDRDRLPTEIEATGPGQIVIVLEDESAQASLAANQTDSSNISLKKEKDQPQPRLSAVDQLEVRVLKSNNSLLTSKSFTASGGRFSGSIQVPAQNDLKVLCIGRNNGVVERFGIDDDVDVRRGATTTAVITGWNSLYIPRITGISPNPSTDGSFRVSWSSVTGAAGYLLQEATNSSFSGAITAYSGSAQQASISGKSPSTYYYRVQATNNYNVTSDWSDASSVEVVVPQDTTAPPPVADLQAVAGDGRVSLSWTNPTDSDYRGTLIVHKTGAYPVTYTDGTEIYRGTGASLVDSALTNGTTYYYAAFTFDADSNYSVPVTASATPQDTIAPPPVANFQAVAGDGQVSLSWTNPTDSDYRGTLIVQKTGAYPVTYTDGTEIYRGTGASLVDSALTNGTTYYYAAFTFDADSNYSVAVTAGATPEAPSTEIIMVSIPAGTFQMGSTDGEAHEKPVHTVTFDYSFEMSATEITQEQYESITIIGINPSYFTGDGKRPVEQVSWFDAVTFCNILSEQRGLEPCYDLSTWECDFNKNGFRLPTEAEWEYACCAGTTTKYYTGDSESDLDRAGWYDGNSGETTHLVGEKEPNTWGLYDMHGNVFEWCNDWYSAGYYSISPSFNPTGPRNGSDRVARGGAYYFDEGSCRSALRDYSLPDYAVAVMGFRVVRGGFVPSTLGYSLQGRILESGSGLEGVEVHITGIEVDTTLTTLADGGYSLSGLEDGKYTITPSKSGYTFSPESLEVTISGANVTAEEIQATSGVPEAPNLIDPGDSVTSGISYTLAWNRVSGATSYTIIEGADRAFSGAVSQTVTDTTLAFSHVVNTTSTYYYIVQANNEQGSSAWSNLVDMVVNPPLPPDGIIMVFIPSGTFQMGSNDGDADEKPVHTVTLNYTFEMSATEITQTQYQEVAGTNPSNFSGDDNRPVEQVNWFDAVTFCNELSELEGLESCYDLDTWECDFSKDGYRLPTEAEWEYACRAGTTTNYNTGDSESDLDRVGWYGVNSGNITHAVGGKEANAYGLYDMHGNVYEWCNDWWGFYSSESQTNPTGPESGSPRVLRGGSWYHVASVCRSANRDNHDPDSKYDDLGFRVARGSFVTPIIGYTLQGRILDNGTGLAGVTVRTTGNGVDTTLTTVSDGSYILTDLADGTYTITPSKSGYTFSPESLEATISGADVTAEDIQAVPAVPPVPSLNDPGDSVNSGTSYTLSWTSVTGATSYTIEEATDISFSGAVSRTANTTSLSFSHSVISATTYYYRVKANNEAGSSGWSNTENIVITPIPDTTSIKLTDTTGTAGSEVTVRVFATGGKNIAGADLELLFDVSRLQVNEVEAGSDASAMSLMNLDVEEANTGGNLRISMVDFTFANPVDAGTDCEILVITFTIASGASGDIPLTLSELSLADESAADIPATAVNGTITVTGPAGNYLKVTDASGSAGSEVTVQVLAASEKNIAGADYEVMFDVSRLQAKEVKVGSDASSMALMSLDVAGANSSGTLRISMVDFTFANPIAAGTDREILTITFTIAAGASGDIPLTLSGFSLSDESAADIPVSAVNGKITVSSPSQEEPIMVLIPGGTFQMGQVGIAEPVHQVTLSALQMSKYEITQAQYEALIGTNPSHFSGDDKPVEKVSWYDAVTFCNKLSEAAGLEPCYDLNTWECDFSKTGYRLPTEAEWEYACRAGTITKYYTGDSESDLDRAGWYSGNSGGETHPVGQKEPNAWELYDMHGNVWEWCNDRYGNYSSGSENNPQGPSSGFSRVTRGGSLNNDWHWCRVSDRSSLYYPDGRGSSEVGFRVVRR